MWNKTMSPDSKMLRGPDAKKCQGLHGDQISDSCGSEGLEMDFIKQTRGEALGMVEQAS